MAVIAWDVAHNALGRAWVLAEILRRAGHPTDLVGMRKGNDDVWLPLRDAEPAVCALRYSTWGELVRGIVDWVETHPLRTVVVSKPRFASMLMGLEYKRRWGARVIVDVDDWELALVGRTDPQHPSAISHAPDFAFKVLPGHPYWTRIAEGMMTMADAVTVSNPNLQRRFGGTVIRHARDERVFDASLFDKRETRQRFGLPADRRIVMFLGTPRRHKGLQDVLGFMAQSGASDLLLCVVDSIGDAQFRSELAAAGGDRLVFVPAISFADIPALLSTADFVCLALDTASDVTDYQVPAKITDAIAMRVPVLMASSPAVADLFDRRIFINNGPLNAAAFTRAVQLPPAELAAVTDRAYRVFVDEFSMAASALKMEMCLQETGNKPLPPWSRHINALVARLCSEARQYPS
ncbi:MAG: glycosyltransferase [Pseudomonadota bacterium]